MMNGDFSSEDSRSVWYGSFDVTKSHRIETEKPHSDILVGLPRDTSQTELASIRSLATSADLSEINSSDDLVWLPLDYSLFHVDRQHNSVIVPESIHYIEGSRQQSDNQQNREPYMVYLQGKAFYAEPDLDQKEKKLRLIEANYHYDDELPTSEIRIVKENEPLIYFDHQSGFYLAISYSRQYDQWMIGKLERKNIFANDSFGEPIIENTFVVGVPVDKLKKKIRAVFIKEAKDVRKLRTAERYEWLAFSPHRTHPHQERLFRIREEEKIVSVPWDISMAHNEEEVPSFFQDNILYQLDGVNDSYFHANSIQDSKTHGLFQRDQSHILWDAAHQQFTILQYDPRDKKFHVISQTITPKTSLKDRLLRYVSRKRKLEEPFLDSTQKVIEELHLDGFQWVTEKDLDKDNNPFIKDFLKELDPSTFTWVELKRLLEIDPEGLLKKTNHVNYHELLYMAGKNYSRLVELTGRLINSSLGKDTAEGRVNRAMLIWQALRERAELFTTLRKEKERELFGETVSAKGDLSPPVQVRWVSHETLGNRYTQGKALLENHTFLLSNYIFDTVVVENEDQALAMLGEVYLHEDEHLQRTKKEINLRSEYEEVLTEWVSVVYPYSLRDESPIFLNSYHYEADSNNKGGAYRYLELMQEAQKKAAEKGYSAADVERCALLSALQRQLTGDVSFKQFHYPAFADLYREITGSDFFVAIGKCRDEDYRKVSTEIFNY